MTDVNVENGKFLEDQLLNLGMGELRDQLWAKIPQGEKSFQLEMVKMYGDTEAKVTPNFGLSEKGYYFINNFDLQVKMGEDVLKQNFRVNSKPLEANVLDKDGQTVLKDGKPEVQYVNSNFTLKEAFNMLAEKTSVLKDFVNAATKEKYAMWINLDFKNTDKEGNFLKLRTPSFDLEAKLKEYPIKELQNEESKNRLIASLERGNARQSVTFVDEQKVESKMYIKAVPQFKSIDVYNEKMERQRFVIAPKDGVEQQGPGKKKGQTKGKGNSVAPDGGKKVTNKKDKPSVSGEATKKRGAVKKADEKKSSNTTTQRRSGVRR